MRNLWTTLILAGGMLAGGWFLGTGAYAADQDEKAGERTGGRFVIEVTKTDRFNTPVAFLLDNQTGDTWVWRLSEETWEYHALPSRINGCRIAFRGCEAYSPVE